MEVIYRKALSLDARSMMAYVRWARILRKAGNEKQAILILKPALDLEPNRESTLNFLAAEFAPPPRIAVARHAVLFASSDGPKTQADERATIREKARCWLESEVERSRKGLASARPVDRTRALRLLRFCQLNSAFAPVRDDARLAKTDGSRTEILEDPLGVRRIRPQGDAGTHSKVIAAIPSRKIFDDFAPRKHFSARPPRDSVFHARTVDFDWAGRPVVHLRSETLCGGSSPMSSNRTLILSVIVFAGLATTSGEARAVLEKHAGHPTRVPRHRETRKFILSYMHMGGTYSSHEILSTVKIVDKDGDEIPGYFGLKVVYEWTTPFGDNSSTAVFMFDEMGTLFDVKSKTTSIISQPFDIASATLNVLGNVLLQAFGDQMTKEDRESFQKLVDDSNAKGLMIWALNFQQKVGS